MTLPDSLTRHPDGEIRLTGHRIGLYHVVRLFNDGASPEAIVEQYPTLPRSLVQQVIGFYLNNRSEVDEYVRTCRDEIARQRANGRHLDVDKLHRRFEAVRSSQLIP